MKIFVSLIFLLSQNAQASMFDFFHEQLFANASNVNMQSVLGNGNAAMFSGRCHDNDLFADFPFNGALIVVKEQGNIKMFPFNQLLNAAGGDAGEAYFDDKAFRPWGDFYQVPIYYNVGNAFPREREWASINSSYSQIYLLRAFEGDFFMETAKIVGGSTPTVGEVEIVCRFSRRLPNIPFPTEPGDPLEDMLRRAVPARVPRIELTVNNHYHYPWYFRGDWPWR